MHIRKNMNCLRQNDLITIEEVCDLMDDAVDNITYSSLTASQIPEVTEIIDTTLRLKVFDEIGNSREALAEYFQNSLANGTCHGQMISFFKSRGNKNFLLESEHIDQSILYQVINEIKKQAHNVLYDMQNFTGEEEQKPTDVHHLVLKKDEMNALIEKIEKVENDCLENYTKSHSILLTPEEGVCASAIPLSENSSTNLDQLLSKEQDLLMKIKIYPLEDTEDNHAVGIMKIKNTYHLYDSADRDVRLCRSFDSRAELIKNFSLNCQSLYKKKKITKIKCTVLTPKQQNVNEEIHF